jgi:hypothetical protein
MSVAMGITTWCPWLVLSSTRSMTARYLRWRYGDEIVLDRSTTRSIFRPSESFSPDMPDIKLQKLAGRSNLLDGLESSTDGSQRQG